MKIKIDILKELIEKGKIETTRILLENIFNVDRAFMWCLYSISNKDMLHLHIFITTKGE